MGADLPRTSAGAFRPDASRRLPAAAPGNHRKNDAGEERQRQAGKAAGVLHTPL